MVMSQFVNLVFKGGGVKGVAYIGAVAVLEELGLMRGVRRLCGTSSGAMVAAHVALGGRAQQLRTLMESPLLHGLLDRSRWPMTGLGHMMQCYGWFQGARLSAWLRRHVEELSGKTDMTLGELGDLAADKPESYKDLTVVATDVSRQCPAVFSARTTPDLPIWKALRASMSIPFLFGATRIDPHGVFVDGGVTWNYPLSVYDDYKYLSHAGDPRLYSLLPHPSDGYGNTIYNKETLGLMVETRTHTNTMEGVIMHRTRHIESLPGFIVAMIGLMTDVASGNFLNKADWQRTIFIEAHGVRATDFDISSQAVAKLIESGEQAARSYLSWFEKPAGRPVNRIPE